MNSVLIVSVLYVVLNYDYLYKKKISDIRNVYQYLKVLIFDQKT